MKSIPKKYQNKVFQSDVGSYLKEIPSSVVDVSVTSPPYNKQEKNKGGLVDKVIYKGFKDRLPEDEYQKQQVDVLNEVYRVTKEGGSFFYNHKLRWDKGSMMHPMDWLRKTDWVVRQEIIWDRILAGNIRGWRFWQVEERIYWLYKPIGADKIGEELKSKHALMTSIWRASPERHNPHPAPFPLWLPTRAIISVLDKNPGVVLDPYAGSGTTCVAAKLLGLDFLGVEIGQEYADYANKRLKNCEEERPELERELSLHQVRKTFSERKAKGEYRPKTAGLF